ncbi:hypothetical protein HOF92_16040 [bacterium]|jgi:hypothetical protein|nr:hypothetical protein [bacterium]
MKITSKISYTLSLFYHKPVGLILYVLVGISYSDSISEFLLKPTIRGVYIDSHVGNLQLKTKDEFPTFKSKLGALSKTIPLRIVEDKGTLKILPSVFRSKGESVGFHATILTPGSLVRSEVLHKLQLMGDWFLRFRVASKKSPDHLWIFLQMSPNFFLNQFHQDFQLFVDYIFSDRKAIQVVDLPRWIQWQRQLLRENYVGVMPDPTTLPDPAFSRASRRGVLSDVLR